jgi:hypothetical protein
MVLQHFDDSMTSGEEEKYTCIIMEIKTKIFRCLNAWNTVDVAKQIV